MTTRDRDEGTPTVSLRTIIIDALEPWANWAYGRYGYPVYLVGSLLDTDDARDIDIRIVLPTEQFYGRFPRGNEDPKFGEELGKQNRWLVDTYKRNFDFQIQSEQQAAKYEDCPKVRLDSVWKEDSEPSP